MRKKTKVRGWEWLTTPALLAEAKAAAEELGMNQTQFLEAAITRFLEEIWAKKSYSSAESAEE